MTDPVGTTLAAVLFALAAVVGLGVVFYDRATEWLCTWLDKRRNP